MKILKPKVICGVTNTNKAFCQAQGNSRKLLLENKQNLSNVKKTNMQAWGRRKTYPEVHAVGFDSNAP